MPCRNALDILQTIADADFVLSTCGEAARPLRPVVVTLDQRPDRWRNILASLSRAGISEVIKFRAMHGAAISDETRDTLIDPGSNIDGPPKSHLALTRPAAGCFLSHLQIWKKFLASEAELLVVLEDDAAPSASYSAARASAIKSSLPANTDLVLLGCSIMGDLAEDTASGPLKRVFYFNGTYAYLVTRRGCLNLLPHLVPLRAHIDHQISAALVKNPDSLFAYAAIPALFDHDFTTLSDAYVPLETPEAADAELGALIDSAREALKHNRVRMLTNAAEAAK
jgi:glycosyl transferase family 25